MTDNTIFDTKKSAWLAELDKNVSIETVGTKAYNLYQLQQLGFSVPNALVIRTFDNNALNMSNSDELMQELEKFSHVLNDYIPSSDGWAVRSSATIEDLHGQSMAGRFDTHFIKSNKQLCEAVQKVWDSASLANIGPESMGVVIQQLIEADFAGVAFSQDPIQNDETTVVELVAGQASRLVDGELSPFRVRISEAGYRLPDGFDTSILNEIDQGVQRLAKAFGYAVDVEWALKDKRLYWLQVRPLTTKAPPQFTVADDQRARLSGLWVRMQHCFSPQMPLVISMNPGGYFNYPDWESQLVNQFHYIKIKPSTEIDLPDSSFDKILDRWDTIEDQYNTLLDNNLNQDLNIFETKGLWQELNRRIQLKRDVYREYLDPEFLHIRKQTEESIRHYIRQTCHDETAINSVLSTLLSELQSKTEAKQLLLGKLAALAKNNSAEAIQSSPEWHHFIKNYGFESSSSQLFYVPTLAETPDLILQMIEHIAENQAADKQAQISPSWHEQATIIDKALCDEDIKIFRKYLSRLRRCMKRTEDDDYLLQKATAQVRQLLLHIGKRLTQNKILKQTDDVFFLIEEELEQALTQSEPNNHSDLIALIEQRKQEFNNYKLLSPPAMIVNGRPMNPKTKSEQGTLKGTAASPGISTGTAIILNDPFSCMSKSLPKDSIVITPIIAPSFAYSLMGCAALVTEIGGLASHGAIVAREMGIPAVVGIKGARELIKTGMSITVDGTKGQVILNSITK